MGGDGAVCSVKLLAVPLSTGSQGRSMKDEQRSAAKKQMMALMQAGQPWQEAARIAGVQTSRSTAYRWFQQFRTQGEAGVHDWRDGRGAHIRRPTFKMGLDPQYPDAKQP